VIRLLRSHTGEISFLLDGTRTLLRDTLLNAYQFSTYRSLFHLCGVDEHTLRADAIRALRRLNPSFKKDYVSLQKDSLERIQTRPFTTDWTSGSTAKPMLRLSSPEDEEAEAEAVRRAFQSSGITRDDRVAFLDVGASDIYLFYGRVLSAMGNPGPYFVKVTRRQNVSARLIARLRPTVVISVPSVLSRCLADLALEKNRAPAWDLRKIIYIGEAMHSRLKAQIRRELSAACLSFYGTTEVGSVGIECERSGEIHIPLDLMFPTLLPHEGRTVRTLGPKSYEGVVAWTSLRFRDHPLIKFCVGDLVRISLRTCPCGSPFPALRFERRLDHSFGLFGIKFTYDLFLDRIHEAVGGAPHLEIHVSHGTSQSQNAGPSRIRFILEKRYRHYVKRCTEEILATHPIEDFVERGLLQISFQFVPATYFHRRKTRRIVLVRSQSSSPIA